MGIKYLATGFAILAAVLYAVNIPFSKILLQYVGPTMLVALLYLGAGAGLLIYRSVTSHETSSGPLTRKELPFVIGMIVLDILAPILLMIGLQQTASSSASLLNNFEIVVTSLIALFVFGEKISPRLSAAIVLVVIASILVGSEGSGSLTLDVGSMLILAATFCWGLENNSTRAISSKNSIQITVIKGIFSGMGSLFVALVIGESIPSIMIVISALVLGLLSYGLSINFYILAQRELGAAKTSAYYSIAPFIGVLLGIVILGERPDYVFYIGLLIMAVATLLMVSDSITSQHTHKHVHSCGHIHIIGGHEVQHSHTFSHSHIHAHSGNESMHDHMHGRKHAEDHTHQ